MSVSSAGLFCSHAQFHCVRHLIELLLKTVIPSTHQQGFVSADAAYNLFAGWVNLQSALREDLWPPPLPRLAGVLVLTHTLETNHRGQKYHRTEISYLPLITGQTIHYILTNIHTYFRNTLFFLHSNMPGVKTYAFDSLSSSHICLLLELLYFGGVSRF